MFEFGNDVATHVKINKFSCGLCLFLFLRWITKIGIDRK